MWGAIESNNSAALQRIVVTWVLRGCSHNTPAAWAPTPIFGPLCFPIAQDGQSLVLLHKMGRALCYCTSSLSLVSNDLRWHMEYSQVVRRRFLMPAYKGSNPFTPDRGLRNASLILCYFPLIHSLGVLLCLHGHPRLASAHCRENPPGSVVSMTRWCQILNCSPSVC